MAASSTTSTFTVTAMGARLLRHWLLLPLRHPARIRARAQAVGALCRHRGARERLRSALGTVRDIERLAGRVALGRATPRDCLALGTSLQALPAVRDAMQDAAARRDGLADVACLWARADALEPLGATVLRALVPEPPVGTQEGGIFAPGHDDELDGLIALATDSAAFVAQLEADERQRTGISGLKVRYSRVFGYCIEVSRLHSHAVPEHYVRRQTLANAERYVTDALREFEQRVLSAQSRRHALEARLFAELLQRIQGELAALRGLVRLVAQTDALAALGAVAEKHRYVEPAMVESPTLMLEDARHPVVEVMLPGGEPFVPNSIELDADSRALLLVTGPNMAGKSTLMRQVALCVIMAQMGGFVPARSATIGICDAVFTRVGASDNLARGQSTFMVEMMETAAILRHATPHSLVLLDEIGRGTSTYDGLSIAWAVAEHLHDVNRCRTLFATHYHELTELTRSRPRAVAAQVAVREQGGRVVFLRQLLPGAADRSYGIEVARLAHLPAAVLERAQALLGDLERSRAVAAEQGGGVLPTRQQLALFAGAQQDAAAPRSAPAGRGRANRAAPPAAAGRIAEAPASVAPAAPEQPEAGAAVLEALCATGADDLTPMQALQLVQRLQQRLKT